MAEKLTAAELRAKTEAGTTVLLTCHFKTIGSPIHPCGKAHKALEDAGIAHESLMQASGRPFAIGTKGTRPNLNELTGSDALPALLLPDGTTITGSGAIVEYAKGAS